MCLLKKINPALFQFIIFRKFRRGAVLQIIHRRIDGV